MEHQNKSNKLCQSNLISVVFAVLVLIFILPTHVLADEYYTTVIDNYYQEYSSDTMRDYFGSNIAILSALDDTYSSDDIMAQYDAIVATNPYVICFDDSGQSSKNVNNILFLPEGDYKVVRDTNSIKLYSTVELTDIYNCTYNSESVTISKIESFTLNSVDSSSDYSYIYTMTTVTRTALMKINGGLGMSSSAISSHYRPVYANFNFIFQDTSANDIGYFFKNIEAESTPVLNMFNLSPTGTPAGKFVVYQINTAAISGTVTGANSSGSFTYTDGTIVDWTSDSVYSTTDDNGYFYLAVAGDIAHLKSAEINLDGIGTLTWQWNGNAEPEEEDPDIPEYDYNDSYEGPEGDYSSGISSAEIASKYNLTVVNPSDLKDLSSMPFGYLDILILDPSVTEVDGFTFIPNDNFNQYGLLMYIASLVTNFVPSSTALEMKTDLYDFVDYSNGITSVNYIDVITYHPVSGDPYTLIGSLFSSYDVIYITGWSVDFDLKIGGNLFDNYTYTQDGAVFLTQRYYQKTICNNLTDGFTMMSDYLFDLSEQNNALYSVLYSGLSDSSSPIVQLRNNSITEIAVLNSILTGINKLAPLQNWEPYDDTDVIDWLGKMYTLIEAQEIGVKLDDIINCLNGTLVFDDSGILAKLDEVITAIENISVNINQTVIQEEKESILDRILDILQEIISALIKVVTKLLEVVLELIGEILEDVLELFDYVLWLFKEGISGDNDYMNVFESEDEETADLMTQALSFLGIFGIMFNAAPAVIRMLLIVGCLLIVVYALIREV